MTFNFTAAELSEMRQAQAGHMMDMAIIQRHGYTANDLNEQVSAWTDDATSTIIGISQAITNEQRNSDMTVLPWDATARLPVTVSLDAKDRIKVTHLFGEALSAAVVYEVFGPIRRGPSGLQVRLKKVQV